MPLPPSPPTTSTRFPARWRLATLFIVVVALLGVIYLQKSLHKDEHAPTRIIHREPSRFGEVLVFEEQGQRCLDFNDVEHSGRQTCVDLSAPDQMVFNYTRMMTSALFVQPAPRSILIIGLGGATLQNALHQLLPETIIDTIDVDPAVARVAERFFNYRPGPRQRLFIEDGRAFVERAVRLGQQYDMVMLDAFDEDYIPEHLQTQEFLEHVRGLLSPIGVVVANTFTRHQDYERESATYAAVFGEFFNLRAGNRVIIARPQGLPDDATLKQNAQAWAEPLRRFGIDVERERERFSTVRDWDPNTLPFKDPMAQ